MVQVCSREAGTLPRCTRGREKTGGKNDAPLFHNHNLHYRATAVTPAIPWTQQVQGSANLFDGRRRRRGGQEEAVKATPGGDPLARAI